MRSDEDFATEALRRATVLKAQRKRRRERLTAGTALVACLSLAAVVVVLSGPYPGPTTPVVATGQAPLLFPGVGGYVLCGVISFVLGVAVTLLCLRKRKSNGSENGIEEQQERGIEDER
jgi:hypothetical protein